MIISHLSRMMGERRIKIAELARQIDVHRNSITLLYEDRAARVELEVLSKLCKFFECSVADLLEYKPDPQQNPNSSNPDGEK